MLVSQVAGLVGLVSLRSGLVTLFLLFEVFFWWGGVKITGLQCLFLGGSRDKHLLTGCNSNHWAPVFASRMW